MKVSDRLTALSAAGIALIFILSCCGGCLDPQLSADPGQTTAQSSQSEAPTMSPTMSPLPLPTLSLTPPPTMLPTPTATPSPTQTPTQTPSPSPSPATAAVQTGFSALLAAYLADPENGASVGESARRLNSGDWHNACVYVASEALRRVGCAIPQSTNYTPVLMRQLTDRGFTRHTDLTSLQPGDICFTTDEAGKVDGIPTHTFIFLGWADADEMEIFDNQMYDYGSLYHTRQTGLSYFEDDPARPKEAIAFFMRSLP